MEKGVLSKEASKDYDSASAAFHNENYAAAIEIYDRVIAALPTYSWTYHDKGFALLKLKRYKEALTEFNKAIALNPRDEIAIKQAESLRSKQLSSKSPIENVAASHVSVTQENLAPNVSSKDLEELAKIYSLELSDNISPLIGGEVNDTFLIKASRGKFVLRRYNSVNSRILREHKVLETLDAKEFRKYAPVIAAKIEKGENAKRYRHLSTVVKIGDSVYTVFKFLEGRRATNEDHQACAKTLAEYHNAIRELDLPTSTGFVRSIMYSSLRKLDATISEKEGISKEVQSIRNYVVGYREFLENLERRAEEARIPKIACHSDIHFGNYIIDDSGDAYLIDFEGARKRYQLYDLVLFADLFSEGLSDSNDAQTRFEEVLDSYQSLNPLSQGEKELLPNFLNILQAYHLKKIVMKHEAEHGGGIDKILDDQLVATSLEADIRSSFERTGYLSPQWIQQHKHRIIKALN